MANNQQAQIKQMFKALALNPKEVLLQLSQNGVDPKQILQLVQQAAEQGDPDAVAAMETLQKSMPSHRNGAKINYLRNLQGLCPEGYEKVYKRYARGGQVSVCPVCEKKKQINLNKCGGKVKKHSKGNLLYKK